MLEMCSSTRVTKKPSPIESVAITARPASITTTKTAAGCRRPSKRATRSAGPPALPWSTGASHVDSRCARVGASGASERRFQVGHGGHMPTSATLQPFPVLETCSSSLDARHLSPHPRPGRRLVGRPRHLAVSAGRDCAARVAGRRCAQGGRGCRPALAASRDSGRATRPGGCDRSRVDARAAARDRRRSGARSARVSRSLERAL